MQIARDRGNARLRVVRAIDVYPKQSEQIIPIMIVGSRYWIGICDERQRNLRRQTQHGSRKRWGLCCMTGAIAKKEHIASAQHDVVGVSPAHYGLMIVVG